MYTFDFYQHLLKPLEFQLVFPLVGGFDLVRHLNGQPIHFMANVLPPSATQVNKSGSRSLTFSVISSVLGQRSSLRYRHRVFFLISFVGAVLPVLLLFCLRFLVLFSPCRWT